MTIFLQDRQEKNAKNFCCIPCAFYTSNKYNFEKHLLTSKHKNTTNYNKNTTILQENAKIENQYICECGKIYPYRASLYNHKKKCKYILEKKEKNLNKEEDVSKELILKLVEENTEIKSLLFKQFETMQSQMYEQQKQMHDQINELIPRVGNNNTINKQKLNINIFLNEQCKEAITMEQFIKKIEVTLGDLLITKNKGLSEGVSNIFIENMNKLSVYERPLHCTDVKREIVYIKSEEGNNRGNSQWEIDDDNSKLKNALKKVTHMQQKSLEKWVAEHPNWKQNPREQEEYMKLVKNCTSDLNDNGNKIIKKLCNQTQLNITEN
tara:strand:- start:142 stop:1110 length:969 start_codon:yes stop_codon:yes gene_type:complete